MDVRLTAGLSIMHAPETLPEPLREEWQSLVERTSDPATFSVDLVPGLPAPAQRWLLHSIEPGTPLRRSAVLRQHGKIKVGRWMTYEADWVLSPPVGYIWAATTHVGPLFVRGSDTLTHGAGAMRWRILGRIPFMSVTGPDVDRSAMGRLAGELCFVPAVALSPAVQWEPVDDHRAVACVRAHGVTHRVTMTIGPTGRLERIDVPRWDHPDGKAFHEHHFTAVMDGAEGKFDGFTIPTSCSAGWWHCPDECATEEFIRFTIDHATYL